MFFFNISNNLQKSFASIQLDDDNIHLLIPSLFQTIKMQSYVNLEMYPLTRNIPREFQDLHASLSLGIETSAALIRGQHTFDHAIRLWRPIARLPIHSLEVDCFGLKSHPSRRQMESAKRWEISLHVVHLNRKALYLFKYLVNQGNYTMSRLSAVFRTFNSSTVSTWRVSQTHIGSKCSRQMAWITCMSCT